MKYLVAPLFVVALLLVSSPSQAQTSISSLCTKLTEHQPDSDVNYRAGVDVNGNSVVPADINNGFQPNTNFEIPVTVDLAERLNIDVKGLELKPSFGTLVYTGDNRILYEGQDITNRALYLCKDDGVVQSVDVNTKPEAVESVIQSEAPRPENSPIEIIEGDYGDDTINVIYND